MQRLAVSRWMLVGLFFAFACLTGGCMTENTESEMQWKQWNPDYKPTSPPDPKEWYFW
jgi:hypothetical protein